MATNDENMAVGTEERTEERMDESMEERILRAAEELFLTQGFAGTTTGQIARRAGCNQALVHYYYRTKDNLFDRVFEKKATSLFSNLMEVEISEMPFEDKVRGMVGMHFDYLRQNPHLVTFVLEEIRAEPRRLQPIVDKLRRFPENLHRQIEPLLEAEIAAGRIRPVSTVDLMLTVVSLNIAPFFIMPVLRQAGGMSDETVEAIFARRKLEIIETVLARLGLSGSV